MDSKEKVKIPDWQLIRVNRKPGETIMITLAPEIDRQTPIGDLMQYGIRLKFTGHHTDQEKHKNEIVLDIEGHDGFRILRSELLKRPEFLVANTNEEFTDIEDLKREMDGLSDLDKLALLHDRIASLKAKSEYFKTEGAKHLIAGTKFRDHPQNDLYMVYLEERSELKATEQILNAERNKIYDKIRMKLIERESTDGDFFAEALIEEIKKALPEDKVEQMIQNAEAKMALKDNAIFFKKEKKAV